MKKNFSTKRSLVFSALALLLCVSMLIGTTFAWFTDSVSSGRNTIQSGNLDVELYYALTAEDVANDNWEKVTSTTKIFDYNLWEPGHTKVAYFKIENEGSLALKYQLSADVYAETAGINVANEEFLLSDYLYTAVIPVDATREDILATTGVNLKNSFAIGKGALAANTDKVVAMAIWMPTGVGNEANHNGTNVPSVEFGINLIATQEMSEVDSFGKDYDVSATYPKIDLPAVVTASAVVNAATDTYDIGLFSDEINDDGVNSKQGSVVIKKESIDPAADVIEIVIKKLDVVDSTVELAANETAVTIDITATGIKADNTEEIEVTTNIGAGLGNIRLFHKDKEIDYISYSNTTGVLKFNTLSFSPFTIAYDGEAPVYSDSVVPTAIVTDADALENVDLNWTGWNGFVTGDPEQTLESVYKFVAPHDSSTVKDCEYIDWYCDYYVSLKSDKMDVLPEGSISLGGNYANFGWVGFDNPEVKANTAIPLLASVLSKQDYTVEPVSNWTYADVVGIVKEFLCGVGRTAKGAANADLIGAEFVVELRLINPKDTSEYISVNTITYTFGENGTGSSVVEYYTPAN